MSPSLKGIRTIEDFDLQGQRVFLRLDLNVPMKDGQITDDSRIRGALPTLRYALEHGAKVIVSSHLGRPKTEEDRRKLSLEPVACHLNELLGVEVMLVEDPLSDAPKALLRSLKPTQILMLENLRFEPSETKNGHELVQAIAPYTDIYINDAFGASHRAHASIVGIPTEIPRKGIGFLMKKEVEMLDRVLSQYQPPFVAILGGAKVSDKIGVIENLIDKVDTFIIGGAMAYTFLKAQETFVGESLVESGKVHFASELMKRLDARGKTMLLPVDHRVVRDIDHPESLKVTPHEGIEEGWLGVDIGPRTVELYSKVIRQAKTIFWNGPMGIFEQPEFSKGTFEVAKAVAESEGVSIVGGGDSAAAVKASGYSDKVTHLSTGGGASLEFLQGDRLPGLEVLRMKSDE